MIDFKDFSEKCPWATERFGVVYCDAVNIHSSYSDCIEKNCGLVYAINYKPLNKVVEHEQATECPFCGSDQIINNICSECGGKIYMPPVG